MKDKLLMGLCVLFGLLMLNGGFDKFFHYMPMMELPEAATKLATAFGESGWLMPLVGLVEIIGGLLIILPRYRALGAIIIFPVMVGILLFNIKQAPDGIPIAAVLMLVNLWVIYENRARYMPMIR